LKPQTDIRQPALLPVFVQQTAALLPCLDQQSLFIYATEAYIATKILALVWFSGWTAAIIMEMELRACLQRHRGGYYDWPGWS
jgi:hypothetical protein